MMVSGLDNLYPIFAGMEKLVSWLGKNRLTSFLLASAFYLAVVVFHDEITVLAIRMRRNMGVEGYNLVFAIISAALLVLFLAYTFNQLRKKNYKRQKLFFLGVTILLILLFYLFALVYNIEAVHFGQYLVLAILLFPLIKSYGETVFWVTILGVLDELYQYTILVPFFKYFDFNDIILNLLGAGLGIVLIFISTEYPVKGKLSWKTPSVVFTFVVASVLLILYFTGEFRLYPPDVAWKDAPWIVLNRDEIPPGFWTRAYEGRYYHVTRPGEGLIIMYVLFFFYYLVDYFMAGKKK